MSAGRSEATAATGSTTVPTRAASEQSRDPGDGGDEPRDDRHRVGERQVEALRRRDVVPAEPGVQQQRDGTSQRRAAQASPAGVRTRVQATPA